MLDSLRARLLLWYGLILALIIAIFATSVCFLFWRSRVLDIDRDLESMSAVIVRALKPATNGNFDFGLPRPYRDAEFTERSPHTYFAAFTPGGDLIDRSDPDVPQHPTAPGIVTGGGRRELTVAGPGGAIVVVGRDLRDARHQVLALAQTVGAAGVLVFWFAALGGWFLTGRALAPISRISRVATTMSLGDLSARIPVAQTENELEQLAATLNDAFDRLRQATEAQRRFTADASHELRTPLAIMTAELDWAVARPRDPADYRRTIDVSRRASDRMRRIVDQLLTLARNEGDRRPLRQEAVDLTEAVTQAVSWLEPLARARDIVIAKRMQAAAIQGDAEAIRELLMNLLTNALEYNVDHGRVDIEVEASERQVVLRIIDTGIGIDVADIPHVFDRFYRVDRARSRQSGGAGLGLAIARRIVADHHGTIGCDSALGRGTVITIGFERLVAAPPGAPSDGVPDCVGPGGVTEGS